MARSPRPRPTTSARPSRKAGKPVSESSCSGRLCGSVTLAASSRYRFRAISKVRAPVPPAGWARNTCHASPHHTVRLFVSRLPSRPGSFTTSPEPPIWSAAQVNGFPTLATRPSAPTTATSATAPTSARTTSRRRVATSRSTGTRATSASTASRADHDQHAEQPPVRDAIRPRGAVLDESRSRERPPCDDDRRAGCEQPEQRGLDAGGRTARASARRRPPRRSGPRVTASAGSRSWRRRAAARPPAGRSARGPRRAARDPTPSAASASSARAFQ